MATGAGTRQTLLERIDLVTFAVIFAGTVVIAGTLIIGIIVEASQNAGSTVDQPFWAQIAFVLLLAVALTAGGGVAAIRSKAARMRSAEIRDRARKADDDLSLAIQHTIQARDAEQRRLDEALLLSRVWHSVTTRLDAYHDDAQSRGRRAFNAAMVAMWVGFLVTAGCGAVAVFHTTTNTGTVVAGALGAVSATLSGYVARTHLEAYKAVSRQLQDYFSQPVEASRYLSAERAIHVSGLPDDARRELMKSLVAAMVAPRTQPGE